MVCNAPGLRISSGSFPSRTSTGCGTGEVEAKTKAHNGNASVLDPVACEVILRFFEKLDAVGRSKGVTNPGYATRDGCWQGENGYSNVVNTKRFINEA